MFGIDKVPLRDWLTWGVANWQGGTQYTDVPPGISAYVRFAAAVVEPLPLDCIMGGCF